MIKSKHIHQVKMWNGYQRSRGSYIQVYTLGNGSMLDRARKNGWIVQKYHSEGGERSRYHKNYKLALQDYTSDEF